MFPLRTRCTKPLLMHEIQEHSSRDEPPHITTFPVSSCQKASICRGGGTPVNLQAWIHDRYRTYDVPVMFQDLDVRSATVSPLYWAVFCDDIRPRLSHPTASHKQSVRPAEIIRWQAHRVRPKMGETTI